jgi:glutathione S-transferase
MLTLYHFPSSVCAAKVRLVLEEKELEWDSQIIEILKGEQFQDWYVALNPNAVVPTLVHDGQAICESAVICEYLDDAFPAHALRPSDLVDRSVMRIWASDVDTYMNGICAGITYPATHRHEILKMSPEELQRFYDGHTDKDKLARRRRLIEQGYRSPDARHAVRVYDKFLDKLETQLAESGAWLTGDSYSIADAAVTPYIVRLDMLNYQEWWRHARPHLDDWYERIKARSSFMPAMIDIMPKQFVADMGERGTGYWPEVREILVEEGLW